VSRNIDSSRSGSKAYILQAAVLTNYRAYCFAKASTMVAPGGKEKCAFWPSSVSTELVDSFYYSTPATKDSKKNRAKAALCVSTSSEKRSFCSTNADGIRAFLNHDDEKNSNKKCG
jgi:hypothetical protein